jgi:hypothetical protein
MAAAPENSNGPGLTGAITDAYQPQLQQQVPTFRSNAPLMDQPESKYAREKIASLSPDR